MKVIAMRYLVLLLAVLCTSCSSLPSLKPYHLNVQQGNVVTSKMMLQLKPGMSKSQVRYVMGTPLLQDSFHQDRWDYLYQMNKGSEVVERRRVILEFKNDGLISVRGDVIPAGSPGAENAPIASIKDLKTAKSDKALLNEDPKKSWTERFKFWSDDDKKSANVAAVEADKSSAESKKSWFDNLKFWEDKEKTAAPLLAAKSYVAPTVQAPKTIEPPQVPKTTEPPVVAAPIPKQVIAPQLSEPEMAVPESASNAVETPNEVGDAQPQQKAANKVPVAKVDANTEITTMVNAWADAWRNKNMKAYLKFYSHNFVPRSLSRKAWLAQRKHRIAGRPGPIEVTLEDVKVDLNRKTIRAEFLQHYASTKFADHVTKVLSLSNEHNQWLIVKEVVTTSVKVEADGSKPRAEASKPVIEAFKLRDVTADEKSESMPGEMIQGSPKKALEPEAVVKPTSPVKPSPVKVEGVSAPKEVKPIVKEPAPIKTETNKVDAGKVEPSKDKSLPPEEAPGYFERMLEKIGF